MGMFAMMQTSSPGDELDKEAEEKGFTVETGVKEIGEMSANSEKKEGP
jgi:hypothetical protein